MQNFQMLLELSVGLRCSKVACYGIILQILSLSIPMCRSSYPRLLFLAGTASLHIIREALDEEGRQSLLPLPLPV